MILANYARDLFIMLEETSFGLLIFIEPYQLPESNTFCYQHWGNVYLLTFCLVAYNIQLMIPTNDIDTATI
jgi:hypothetical protein